MGGNGDAHEMWGGVGDYFKLVKAPRFHSHFLLRSLQLGFAIVVVAAGLACVFIKLGVVSFEAIYLRLFCS